MRARFFVAASRGGVFVVTISACNGSTGREGDDNADLGDGHETWSLRFSAFEVPTDETFYSCTSFTVPVDQIHHVVAFQAAVESPYVHHFLLARTPEPRDDDPRDPCLEWPGEVLWVWAPGDDGYALPEDVGFLVGESGSVNFVLQIHYNNPLGETGVVDSSGVDVITTRKLRVHDAAIFTQGDVIALQIPPGRADYTHVATCDPAQTRQLLEREINVFASFLHAHEIGKSVWSELIRDDSVVQIATDIDFSFETQGFQTFDPVAIRPGDSLRTTCVFDSTERTKPTFGGPGSTEEMCLNLMMYYPRVASSKCGSF